MQAFLSLASPSPATARAAAACGAAAILVETSDAEVLAAVAAALREGVRPPALYVRLVAEPTDPILAAALAAEVDGVALSGFAHGRDLARLGARLARHEAQGGRADGATGILAVLDTPLGVLRADTLVEASPRLRAIAWDAHSLAQRLGALPEPAADGTWCPVLEQARTCARLAAAAAGVAAVDAWHAPSGAGGRRRAAADGFQALWGTTPADANAIRGAA